jgi:hypothetical protein
MDTSHGNSLCSYLYLKQAKCHVFLFIFSVFSFKISENRRAVQVLWGGVGTSGNGEVVGKGSWRVNTGKKCAHLYINVKMIPAETILGIRGRGIKEISGGGELNCDIFKILRTCVNATMYPYPTEQ